MCSMNDGSDSLQISPSSEAVGRYARGRDRQANYITRVSGSVRCGVMNRCRCQSILATAALARQSAKSVQVSACGLNVSAEG
jgi:hypothetical protein